MREPTRAFQETIVLLDELKKLVQETNRKLLSGSEEYFVNNINFFTKSFLVLLCAHLEGYLKSVCILIIEEINEKLAEHPIPHNVVRWSLGGSDFKPKDYRYENFSIGITKTNVDDEISGNIERTIMTFRKLGIDLTKNVEFNTRKDKIGSIVNKRNSVVHHNDSASDVSIGDIIQNIEFLKQYMRVIDEEVLKHI